MILLMRIEKKQQFLITFLVLLGPLAEKIPVAIGDPLTSLPDMPKNFKFAKLALEEINKNFKDLKSKTSCDIYGINGTLVKSLPHLLMNPY